MDFETITYKSENNISHIILNRLDSGNAINAQMVKELLKLSEYLEDESKDEVLIIHGAENTFCTGVDLRDFPVDSKPNANGFSSWEKACRTIERLPMLTIAAIDGECAGGGMQLALICDLRIASNNAYFQLHEVQDGFIPGGATFRLSKFIGLGRARKIALTGAVVKAEEAYKMGIVDFQCHSKSLMETINEVIQNFSKINGETILLTRRLFDESFEMSYEDFVGCFLAAQHKAIQSKEFRETINKANQANVPRPI